MKLSSSFLIGLIIAFFLGLFTLSILAWRSETYLPSSNCDVMRPNKNLDPITHSRVSVRFWVRACQPRSIFVGASEATGDHSLPYFLKQEGYEFDKFTGAHRGLKTLGFIMAHDISKERIDNLKILSFLNPIYYSPGPASMAAPMAYRSSLAVRVLNEFVPDGAAGAKETTSRFVFVLAKGLFLEVVDIFKTRLGFVPDGDVTLQKNDFTPDIPTEYDSNKGVYQKFSNNNFSSDFDININPTATFAEHISKNKNQLRMCIVLLPLNERFFISKDDKYKRQIPLFYEQYRQYFSGPEVIDLTDMGAEPYLFADTMHFTEYGSAKIIERVVASTCFIKYWGSAL